MGGLLKRLKPRSPAKSKKMGEFGGLRVALPALPALPRASREELRRSRKAEMERLLQRPGPARPDERCASAARRAARQFCQSSSEDIKT